MSKTKKFRVQGYKKIQKSKTKAFLKTRYKRTNVTTRIARMVNRVLSMMMGGFYD